MNDFFDDLRKFGICLSVIGVFVIIVVLPMYKEAFRLINNVDSSIYARYATNTKFEENVFFNEKIEKNTGILKQLRNEISELEGVTEIQRFAYVLTENKSVVEKVVLNNEKYQSYLIEIGSSVEDLLDWSEKIASISEKILMGCLYLVFCSIAVIMVIVFQFRKVFYVCAGLVYVIAMLSHFTDGISDYLFANVIAILEKLSVDVIYRDIEPMRMIIHQAFKEGALTFIIFDTAVQLYQNKMKEEMRYVFFSINVQCDYLACAQDDDSEAYIAQMVLPIDSLMKRLRNKIMMYKIKTNINNVLKIKTDDLSEKCAYYERLKEKLEFFQCKNNTKYTTKEYVSHLRQLQKLLYTCNFW